VRGNREFALVGIVPAKPQNRSFWKERLLHVILWLSRPFRAFFNARFESAHTELRDVRSIIESLSERESRSASQLQTIVDGLAQLQGAVETAHDQMFQVASVMGRDLNQLREQFDRLQDEPIGHLGADVSEAESGSESRAANPQADEFDVVVPFVVSALAELKQGSRVVVLGPRGGITAASLATLGFDVSCVGVIDDAVGALDVDWLDAMEPFDAAVVVGVSGSSPARSDESRDGSLVLPLLRAGGLLVMSTSANRGGRPPGIPNARGVADLLVNWQDVTVTTLARVGGSGWSRSVSARVEDGSLVLAQARKPEL
jgi:hypothetical protein